MRTAEAIWKEELVLWETTSGGSLEDHIRHAINKGRVEALKEMMKYMEDHSMKHTGTYRNAEQLLNQIK